MKKSLLALAIASAATTATAGTTEAPNMDVTVITQSAGAGMTQDWIVPFIMAALLIVLLGSGGYTSV